MAANIYDWSLTAASNSSADGDINWAEGQAPSSVNGSARVMMERVAEFLADIGGTLTAGGTANGITVTANSGFTTLANGRMLSFIAASDNTDATTLNVNGIGAKAIRKMDSTGDVALAAGEIQAGGVYVVQYNTAANGAAGAWLLVNPTLGASIVTLTGTQTLTNKTLTLPQVNDTTADHQYVFAVSELAADRTVTLPLLTGNDEFVFAAHTKALTNKDISSSTNTYRQATDSAIGAVELATAAEIRTGTDDTRALTIDKVYDAADRVQLTDAATIAVDMSTFINAHVVIAGDRTLGTATNAKEGQSGVIRVQASGATRTLTFASNWFLVDPSPIAISSGHELYLYYHVFSDTEPVIVLSPLYNPTSN